jgi:phage terminase large subunit-like protein
MTVPEELSKASLLALLPESQRKEILDSLTPKQLHDLNYDWRFWARPKQLPPDGDWLTWLIEAGRGFGKTRSGAGFIDERALDSAGRWIALVARTPADARDYMIEGPGGFLKNTHPDFHPHYEPSKRRLTWPNGSWATIYSDEEPDQLRGFSGDTAWLDELAKFKNPQECLDALDFGMREVSADYPRRIITTTPRPIKALKAIKGLASTVVVTGSSYENRANLSPKWFSDILSKFEGTRLGRQEIHAETLDDNPGALWRRHWFDDLRVKGPPALKRVVVAIDPATTSNPDSDETGIIVAGLGSNDHGYVLADLSLRGTPEEWARVAVNAYHDYKCDRIIAETNNGGEMVETLIRTVERNIPFTAVHASRGKITRAEPISSLYEQSKCHHVGSFPVLEDQCCEYDPKTAKFSPDHMDALVWAFTELMTDVSVGENLLAYYEQLAREREAATKNH